jgi:hypothetical protein
MEHGTSHDGEDCCLYNHQWVVERIGGIQRVELTNEATVPTPPSVVSSARKKMRFVRRSHCQEPLSSRVTKDPTSSPLLVSFDPSTTAAP